ncbi:MAG: serine/threonine-protein kinase, partial [Myxococcota bacterium]
MTEVVRKLGRYELLRRIAMGGMGEIYLARMRGTGGFEKRVIIKTILPHLAEQDEFVTKFLDEGRIVVDLVHGNIVPVFDMNEEDGEIFLAMEYIPGRDLREVLKRAQLDQVEIPVALSLYIVAELCKGLDYAHRKVDPDGELLEIVHRDISPSNVMLSGTGEVKIIDFGIARASTKLSTSIDGRIQGKFCYMSPEQASGKEVDARSDIFSTGVVLYELLTGMRPFEGYTDLESLELVRAAAYDPAGTLNPKVPQVVDEIIDRALARDRDARYASIDRMQVDLLQHLYSVEGAPTPSEVGAFLDALFPEGVEREELRPPSSRSTSGRRKPSPGQAMSLEDAMALELERMAAGSEDEVSDSNPHISSSRTPAPSKSAETATLVPASVDPRVPERVSQSTAPEAFLDTVEDLAGAAAEARAVAQRPSSGRTPSLPTRLDVDASADGGVDQLAEAAGRTSSADLKDSPERAPGDAAPSAPMSVDIARILGLRRAIAAVGVAVAVAVGAALLGMAVWEDKRQGTIEIRTTPAGASIYIDGALEP